MAKFSKQDYTSIASVINVAWRCLYAAASGDPERQWGVLIDMQTVVDAFVDMFEQDNERFDRERFEAACEGEVAE